MILIGGLFLAASTGTRLSAGAVLLSDPVLFFVVLALALAGGADFFLLAILPGVFGGLRLHGLGLAGTPAAGTGLPRGAFRLHLGGGLLGSFGAVLGHECGST